MTITWAPSFWPSILAILGIVIMAVLVMLFLAVILYMWTASPYDYKEQRVGTWKWAWEKAGLIVASIALLVAFTGIGMIVVGLFFSPLNELVTNG